MVLEVVSGVERKAVAPGTLLRSDKANLTVRDIGDLEGVRGIDIWKV
jgi:hypothetical protein